MLSDTEEVSFALGISHTPWRRERVMSFARLKKAIDVHGDTAAGAVEYKLFDEKAPVWVWAGQMWRWAAESPCSHGLFLQDDLIVAPNFWQSLLAMVLAVPDQIIALETVHPGARVLARNGSRWCTSADGLIGCQYVIPRPVLVEMLDWRTHNLRAGALENMSEDGMINVFAMDTGRKIWHPIPAIARPDVSLPSTYGNDHHTHRTPSVTWEDGITLDRMDGGGWLPYDLERPAFWKPDGVPPHFGRFYAATHWLAREWCRSWNESKHAMAENDLAPYAVQKWSHT